MILFIMTYKTMKKHQDKTRKGHLSENNEIQNSDNHSFTSKIICKANKLLENCFLTQELDFDPRTADCPHHLY